MAIAFNIVIAVRGIRVWRNFHRLNVEGWIRNVRRARAHTQTLKTAPRNAAFPYSPTQIAHNLPWTRRVVKVLDVATKPIRLPLKPFARRSRGVAGATSAARTAQRGATLTAAAKQRWPDLLRRRAAAAA